MPCSDSLGNHPKVIESVGIFDGKCSSSLIWKFFSDFTAKNWRRKISLVGTKDAYFGQFSYFTRTPKKESEKSAEKNEKKRLQLSELRESFETSNISQNKT